MKRLLIILIVLAVKDCMAQDARPFLEGMYNRYHNNWRESLIFTQKTEKYLNDSVVGTDTWYETMVYPKSFRIDFGTPDSGNCVIFRNDSAYIFRSHKLVKSNAETNELLYYLGGMYYSPSFAEVCSRFSSFGIHLGKSYLRGNIVVMGADVDSTAANQLWIEAGTYKIMRLIRFDNGHRSDAVFSAHKKVRGRYCETKVMFMKMVS